MSTIAESIFLYVETVKKWKDQAEKNVVTIGAVCNGQVYVDGKPCEYESVSANRVVNGDFVYVAQTSDEARVVVLG